MRRYRAGSRRTTALIGFTVVVTAAQVACGRVGYELEPGPVTNGGGPGAGGAAENDGGALSGSGGKAGSGGTGGVGGAVDGGADASLRGNGGAARDGGSDARSAGGSTSTLPDGGDAATCRPSGVAPDYCASIPKLPAPPVIDGELDCGVLLRPLVPVGWNNPSVPLPPDSGADFAVAYRPDGLYFYFAVRDETRIPAKAGDEVWRGDGLELYVDADGLFSQSPRFDNPGTRQIQAAAPADPSTPSLRGELFTWGFAGTREAWTSHFVSVPTATGYVLEAFVTATELQVPSWALTAGVRVGMDLGVNVSDPTDATYEASDGYRLGQYFLRVASTDGGAPPFFDVGAFCLPTLAP